MPDRRRTYYDHEATYRAIRAAGGRGWDDRAPEPDLDSYASLCAFLDADGPPAPGARALDLGCGGGQAGLELARRGYRVSGLDFSETAIELARRNADEAGVALELVVGDALGLAALGDARFDLVVDNHLLHCLVTPDDRARVLASIHRVLVPGGRLWSETMSAGARFDPARFDVDPDTGVARNGGRIWIRRAVLEAELAAAGFEVLSLVERDQVPPEDGTDLVTLARRCS